MKMMNILQGFMMLTMNEDEDKIASEDQESDSDVEM
jgi:hypothetical protein